MAEYRTDPFYLDINLMSTLDLQSHMTDYIEVINEFPEELVISNAFRHTDSHSDPITSKIQFFKSLNDNSIAIKDNLHGARSEKVDTTLLSNKNVRDQLDINQYIVTTDGNMYGEPSFINDSTVKITYQTRSREWLPVGEDIHMRSNGQWKINITTTDGSQTITPALAIDTNNDKLPSTSGMENLSPWFILYWMEKFNTAHHRIKEDLLELLGEDNEYFVRFSESVGQLKNVSAAEDTSTLPIWDETVEALSTTPNIINTVAKYCTKPETQQLSEELSKKTNAIFRSNLRNIQDDPSRDVVRHKQIVFSTTSHGINVVCDSPHRNRIYQFIQVIRDAIEEHLKGLYEVLELLSNRENHMTADKPKEILMKVEGFTVSVDLLKNKIKAYDRTGIEETVTRYGKSTQYGYIPTNASILAIPGIKESPNQ